MADVTATPCEAKKGRARITVKRKLTLILALMWVAMCVLVASLAWLSRATMLAEREQGAKQMVQYARSLLAYFDAQANAGD